MAVTNQGHSSELYESTDSLVSDSKSVLEAIDSQENKNPLIMDTLESIYKLRKRRKYIEFCWIPSHIGIIGNEKADRAAKAALDLEEPLKFVPYTGKYPQVKEYVNKCWQEFWNRSNGQKLYEMMPVIGEFNVSSLTRKEQVIIHRIRIGHTRLTHSYLMEGRLNAPLCDFCDDEILTVKHFMIYCPHYLSVRRRFYNVSNMKELFDEVSLRRILSFLKEAQLFNLL